MYLPSNNGKTQASCRTGELFEAACKEEEKIKVAAKSQGDGPAQQHSQKEQGI